MALTGLAIMAAIGAAKSQFVDKPKEERQRKLAAETQKLSPWTKMQAGPIQEADPVGSAMQYGALGASMGGSMKNAQAQNQATQNPYASTLASGGGGGGQGNVSGYNYNQSGNDFWNNPYAK